ncbi:siderochrome-iron uptake transporter [Kockovaella imperatae]|uniref:Siderochrome-iron uptake transporter n=1 Tax=Kockovaella imperatae TaxID=4999 RepID=A0A1Y1UL19_9TREE|nr:siderochrome-iron uptake transporter [Kockovaella imperatae]ORX38194.1 siderochrome-iron uptake transporter [Kockovaella imperatae]
MGLFRKASVTHLYPDDAIRHELEQQGDTKTAFGDKSPGVRRIEAISKCFTSWHLYVLFISIFFVSCEWGCLLLDGFVRFQFQTYAVASFGLTAQISTVNVVRGIVAAAAQPAFAKISDYFGRISILFIAAMFYVVGTILCAASKDLAQFSGGALLYQFGYTGIQLLVEVIIADTTSLRSRLFFSYIPALPGVINTWVSGNVVNAVLANSSWRWGIGMWAIIFPVLAIPLLYCLVHAEIRAGRAGYLDDIPSPFRSLSHASLWTDVFWQIDLVGLLLLAASFALILLPFTLAGGVASLWPTARIITPLVVGFVVALPIFVIWELKFARHPVVPFRLLKDRQILAGLTIACLLNTAWYCQGDYLYQILIVSFDRDIISATRTQNIYTFVSVITGVSLGLVVRKVRRIKWFVVAGTSLFVLAFGLLIRFRGGKTSDYAGLVAGEVILGLAGGLFPYPTQVLVQSAVQHERTAVITSLYLACYSIGSALGNTIAAGILTNTLPGKIQDEFVLHGINNATLAAEAYADPYGFSATWPMGTPQRDALAAATRETQRLMCIAGICISSLLVFVSLCLKNPHLSDEQSFENAEGREESIMEMT